MLAQRRARPQLFKAGNTLYAGGMNITPIGYLFFASLLFGIVLTIAVNRRLAKNGKPQTLLPKLYWGTIIVVISNLFIMFSFFGGNEIYKMVSLPKYEATVIDFNSQWEKRDDGRVLMHTPKLQFRDSRGEVITQDGNVRSSAEPVIGDTVRVAYADGTLYVISGASIGLLIALAVMLLILGYILAALTNFALGRKWKWVDNLGVTVFAIVIYGGMLFMLGAMIYGVFKYFQPGSDMPLWAMLMCLFFSLVLALAMVGMVRMRMEET